MAADDATEPLMAAIRTALRADAQLSAITAKVYDRPPTNEPTPFLTIGETSWDDWSTSDTHGQEIALDVHAWDEPGSHAPDTRRVRALMGHIRRILHEAVLPIPGHNLVNLRCTRGVGPMVDPDGRTLHGVVTVRALVGNA